MHERTTRAIARWLFVACCAAPTCLTMLGILLTWTPWYNNGIRHELEDQLALQTGLHVEIGDFERSDPTTWRLFDLKLTDSETKQPVASVRNACWVAESQNTVIRLSQPEVHVESLDQLVRLIHERFLCRPERTDVPVRFAADDVTLRGSVHSQTLRDVDAGLKTEGSQVIAWIECLPAGFRPDLDGLKIEVTRNRSASPPVTRWSIQTGELSLPVAVLADYFPILERLGDDATFHGMVTAERPDRSSSQSGVFELTGRFDQVDLGRLTEELPHRVTGRASIALDRCQFDGNGGVNVSGEIRAVEGWMSASLLPRLAEDLGCQLTAMTASDFSFDAFAVRFDLYASQLRVQGICRTQPGNEWLPAGVVVSAGGRPIVMSGPQSMPSTNLARLVAPPHSVQVPLSSQTGGLLWILQPPKHNLPGVRAPESGLPESGFPESGFPESGAADGTAIVSEADTEPAARIGRLQPLRGKPLIQPF